MLADAARLVYLDRRLTEGFSTNLLLTRGPVTTVDQNDDRLASRLAVEAGRRLLALRAGFEGDERSLAKEGDRMSHEYIVSQLHDERPMDTVVSEEDGSVGGEALPSRHWLIDPLDGTREYSESRPDFAVHVALIVDGVARKGAVALPAEDLVLATDVPPRLAPRPAGPLRMLVSRTRPPAEATAVADLLSAELVGMGSAGVKAMAVVRGLGDVYLHAGGQYEWDSAAPVAVAIAAGAHASRLDGSPIRYGLSGAWLPDLLVCRPEFVSQILGALESVR
jgi:3'(2'), 5'-bisphosphate nucleotidase